MADPRLLLHQIPPSETDGDVLTTVSGKAAWAAATGGSGGIESIVAGANITVDDTDPANPIISASGGGGGDGFVLDDFLPSFVRSTALDAPYGDAFEAGTLDSKWTRRTVTAGNEAWDQWGGTDGVRWAGPPAAGWYYTQPAPAADDYTVDAVVAVESTATTSLVGPVILDSAGAGIGAFVRKGTGIYMATLSGYAYSGYGQGIADPSVTHSRKIYAIRLKKSGTSYTCAFAAASDPASLGWGTGFSFSSSTTWAGTPDRIGVGCGYTDAGMQGITILRFNVS